MCTLYLYLYYIKTWKISISCNKTLDNPVIGYILYCTTVHICTAADSNADTVWCNQIGTVFAELSSWTALEWYTVMKTAFKTKNTKRESKKIFFSIKVLNFKSECRIWLFEEMQHNLEGVNFRFFLKIDM